MVLKTSLCLNTAIVFTMAAIAIASKSLALLSALVENVIDLFVRGMLAYAGTRTSKQADHAKFPAGTSRLEPVAVIISACVMMVVSIVFIQEGIMKLVDGFGHGTPEPPHLSVAAIVIVTFAVVSKIILNAYSHWVLKRHSSVTVEAIQDDNRNDAASNTFVLVAYIIASARPELWYLDPVGAIVIFLLIMFAWAKMGKEKSCSSLVSLRVKNSSTKLRSSATLITPSSRSTLCVPTTSDPDPSTSLSSKLLSQLT